MVTTSIPGLLLSIFQSDEKERRNPGIEVDHVYLHIVLINEGPLTPRLPHAAFPIQSFLICTLYIAL